MDFMESMPVVVFVRGSDQFNVQYEKPPSHLGKSPQVAENFGSFFHNLSGKEYG